MRKIFYELIEEAKNGYVLIDGEQWPIGFNTVIYNDDVVVRSCMNDNNLSTLVVKNEEKFFSKLEEYVSCELAKKRKCVRFVKEEEHNYIKFLMSYLMVNASTEDFVNPINYMDRYMAFLEDDTFNHLNDGLEIELEGVFDGCKMRIKNSVQGIMMETPNKISISIVKESGDDEFEYKLPDVSYGISTNKDGKRECYVYSLLNPKEKKELTEEELRFKKIINRLLYKVNNGVEVEDDEEEISDISKVSPSAVLSLVTFLTILKDKDITYIKGVPYLPIRYLSREIVSNEYTSEDREKLLDRNEKIQRNVTDKFVRVFMRAAYHFEDSEVMMLPYEYDEFLHFKFGSSLNTNNSLLNDVISATEKESNLKI